MSSLVRHFILPSLALAAAIVVPSRAAHAQFCESSAPASPMGWRSAASGTPGCVPLLPPPGGSPTGVLAPNDDGSAAPLDLSTAFPGGLEFFGGPYDTVVINNNGNVTFGGSLFTYTPTEFPLSGSVPYPMIAPYWADVDTRTGGAPSENYVWWYLEPGRLIVTWYDVGYYNRHDDKKMSFQMILTNASGCGTGDFEVEFRYNRCEWTTGDASSGTGGFGGTPAQVGFDANNGMDYVSVPNSLSMAILDQCITSNVGMPGIWRFSVIGGTVTCPDAGESCDTGMPGACGIGVTQCIGGGVECVGIGTMTSERCDGVDNDCNGMIDDGSDLCASPNVCHEGSCVPPCFEGGCAAGESCDTDGRCVETACIDVTCPAGERCSGGTCVGACAGITCPHGQQCVAGRCLALCDVITCGEGEVCQDGMCRPGCPCNPCGEDEICNADGTCTPVGCDITVCDPGFYCEAGACLDACDGAVCPPGQHCEVGECVDGPGPMADAGVPPTTDAGPPLPGTDSGIPGGGDSGIPSGSTDGGSGAGGRGSSCGCRVVAPSTDMAWGWALVGVALFVRRRRRSRRVAPPARSRRANPPTAGHREGGRR